MISICCCSINSKFETETFINHLHEVNRDIDFEICLAHDNRCDDGSSEYFKALQQKYNNLKIIENTHEDTVNYLKRLVQYYKNNNKFDSNFIYILEKNLYLFENKEFFDHNKSFLWLSSGMLYNKAVSISSGDTLIITPADFLYFFRLNDIQSYVNKNSNNGHFYAKPNTIFARVSNQPKDWLIEHVHAVNAGSYHNDRFRFDSAEVFLDYLRYPTVSDDLYLADFRNDNLYNITDIDSIYRFNTESVQLGGVESIRQFHGFHIISKKTFDTIGGFTEEFYGRAYADDTMTHNGNKYSPKIIPDSLSVAWIRQGELRTNRESVVSVLEKIDPWHATHPIPPDSPKYLHGDYINNTDLAAIVNTNFDKNRVVKI